MRHSGAAICVTMLSIVGSCSFKRAALRMRRRADHAALLPLHRPVRLVVAAHDLDGRLGNLVLVGQASSNAVSGVSSTLIRWGLAVSALGSAMVSTPRL